MKIPSAHNDNNARVNKTPIKESQDCNGFFRCFSHKFHQKPVKFGLSAIFFLQKLFRFHQNWRVFLMLVQVSCINPRQQILNNFLLYYRNLLIINKTVTFWPFLLILSINLNPILFYINWSNKRLPNFLVQLVDHLASDIINPCERTILITIKQFPLNL